MFELTLFFDIRAFILKLAVVFGHNSVYIEEEPVFSAPAGFYCTDILMLDSHSNGSQHASSVVKTLSGTSVFLLNKCIMGGSGRRAESAVFERSGRDHSSIYYFIQHRRR